MIPNGAAYEIFSRVQTEKDALSCPEDMKGLKHPVYGFVGMLQECIDYALIEKLAKERPTRPSSSSAARCPASTCRI